jgi:hypothetical protein
MRVWLPAVLSGLAFVSIAACSGIVPTTSPPASGRTTAAGHASVVAAPRQTAGMIGVESGEPLSHRELTSQSSAVVIGRADSSEIVWADGGRNLFTVVTVAVEETLKGDGSSTIRVALPGGVDANRKFPVAMTYPGAPRLAPSEEVVLFLVQADDEVSGTYAVAGFSQGKFTIEPAPGGVSLRQQGGDRVVRIGDRRVPLATFREEILSYLQ